MTETHALIAAFLAQPLVIAFALGWLINRFDPPEASHD